MSTTEIDVSAAAAAAAAPQAEVLPDGRVRLSNGLLTLVLDPVLGASAVSLVDQRTGIDLATCDAYAGRVLPALREALHVQKVREGRIDEGPRPYELVGVENTDEAATARFRGVPLESKPGRGAEHGALHELALEKTIRLRRGQSAVRVELRLLLDARRQAEAALWISSGLRVPGVDVDVYAPLPRGLATGCDPWISRASSFVTAAPAAGDWTGAVGRDPARTGLVLAASDGHAETIFDWLGTFPGFTLGFGTGLVRLGVPLQYPPFAYALGLTRGLPRIDGATEAAAGAIEVGEEIGQIPTGGAVNPHPLRVPAGTIAVRASVCTMVDVAVTVDLHVRTIPERKWRPAGRGRLALQAGVAGAVDLAADLPREGAYVLRLIVRDGRQVLGRFERPIQVGTPLEEYVRPQSAPMGARWWSNQVGEAALGDYLSTCSRKVKHPMLPWTVPAAGPRRQALFLVEASFNTGIVRDLARRGDMAWDLAVFASSDVYRGPYGEKQYAGALRLLKRASPSTCVLAAGLRWQVVPVSFVKRLIEHVREGGGLVIVGKNDEAHRGVWPAALAQCGAVAVESDPGAVLGGVFEQNIAPGPAGRVQCYELGAGRIVWVEKDLDWPGFALYGDAAPRNDLLPRYRGRTGLPDWEYHFAQYLACMRWAGRGEADARIHRMALKAASVEVTVAAGAAQRACIECEIVSVHRLHGARVYRNVELAAGINTIDVARPVGLPGGEYVLHAWVLEGHVDAPAEQSDDDTLLLREAHPTPVMAFAADVQKVGGDREITIEVADGKVAAPPEVTVRLAGAPSDRTAAQVELEVHHGDESPARVAWRGRQSLPDGASACRFAGITFPITGRHTTLVARVLNASGATRAEAARRLNVVVPGDVAEEDVAYLTAAGGEHDWYATRMVQPWAVANGFDFTYLRYGLRSQGFPWQRQNDNRLEPPIVEEGPLRRVLREELTDAFVNHGNAYVCLTDEFRLRGEYDWSEPTLAAFVQHLRRLYNDDLARLNDQWGTSLRGFEEARPILLHEAQQQSDNPSRWIDFRLFMDQRINRRFEVAREVAAEISPLLRVGDSGAYTPGHLIGINHYAMMRASRFCMSYWGLREEWASSFRTDDSVLGVWLGYGWQRAGLVWEALFKQIDLIGWWGYLLHKKLVVHSRMSAIETDLTPAPEFDAVGAQQREVRRGLGKLLLHATPERARVVLAYSQASAYASEVSGYGYADACTAALALVKELHLPYRFMADEQAGAGELEEQRDALLLPAGSEAMPAEVAAAYGRAVQRGCGLLAEAQTATCDGHGRRLPRGALDELLGIDARGGAANEVARPGEPERITWTDAAPPALRGSKGRLVRALNGVEADAACVWARFRDGTPAVIGRQGASAGSGASGGPRIWLNTRFAWTAAPSAMANPEDRPDELAASQTLGQVLRFLTESLSLTAPIKPHEPQPALLRTYSAGRARYVGILHGPRAGKITLRLPERMHTWDARRGRYLGEVEQLWIDLKPDDLATVLAQLPYQVQRVEVTAPAHATPGQTLRLTGRLHADQPVTELHVIHLRVTRPDGSDVPLLASNLDAPHGEFCCDLPLALNDPPGQWTITATDVATGARGQCTVTVGAAPPMRLTAARPSRR